MAATVAGMTAQVNAPEIDGYLSRGTLMYRDQNYQGAIDQLTQLKRMSPDSHQAEEADFYIALSRLYRGELSEARQLLEAFVGDYPSSSHMLTALIPPAAIFCFASASFDTGTSIFLTSGYLFSTSAISGEARI